MSYSGTLVSYSGNKVSYSGNIVSYSETTVFVAAPSIDCIAFHLVSNL